MSLVICKEKEKKRKERIRIRKRKGGKEESFGVPYNETRQTESM